MKSAAAAFALASVLAWIPAAATTVIVFFFVTAIDLSALAAPAKCNAELRKCNSHCNLVYESGRASRTCSNRCKDKFYVCKARPS
jgi:hypothetical protein